MIEKRYCFPFLLIGPKGYNSKSEKEVLSSRNLGKI